MRIRIIYILRWRNSYPTTKNIIFKEGNKIEGPHESERIIMNNNIDTTNNNAPYGITLGSFCTNHS